MPSRTWWKAVKSPRLTLAVVVASVVAGCSSPGASGGPTSTERADAAVVTRHDASQPEASTKGVDAATHMVTPVDAKSGAMAADASPIDDAMLIPDAAAMKPDATAHPDAMTGGDASDSCSVSGAPGTCITTTACTALGDHTSFAGHCPGAADIECCIVTPSTTDNPPTPTGYVLMQQAQVTAAMTTWAVMILNDPTDYPMFSTTTMTFGTQLVLARVEWHPPDFQNSVIHRGVTLYVPT